MGKAIGMYLELYRKRMEQLKKNKRNVPAVELRTKYREPYIRLLEELKQMTEEILRSVVFPNLLVDRLSKDEVCQEVNQAIEVSGLLDEISHAVYREQDVDKVLKCVSELRSIVYRVEERVRESYGA